MNIVLIIDDDFELNQNLQELLVDRGFKVISAASISEAEDRLTEHQDIGCIISDQHLGDGFGIELFRRRKSQGFSTPFILMSGAFRPAAADLQEGQLEAFFDKPFIFAELNKRLMEVFARVPGAS